MTEVATRFIEELQKLVSAECYPDALALWRRKGVGLLDVLLASELHKKVLLLAADIHLNNQSFGKTREFLALLQKIYPCIECEFEFVRLKIILFRFESKYDACSAYISECWKREWTQEESAWLKCYEGGVAFWKGDYFTAECLYSECQDYARLNDDGFLAGSVLYMTGYIAYQRCFFEIAEVNYKRALDHFIESGRYVSQGHSYKMLAILASRTGEYDKAEKLIVPALKCFEKTGNRRNVINSNILMGRVNIFRGDYPEAEKLLTKCYRHSADSGYRREAALSGEFLGELCYHTGRFEESLKWLKKAGQIVEEIAPEGDVAVEVFRRLGEVNFALGKIEEAEVFLSRAHKLCDRLSDRYELGSVLRAYGMIALGKGDLDLAMSFFNDAAVSLKLIKESFEHGCTLQLSAEACERWVRVNGSEAPSSRELLGKARDNAVEAMHLFSSKGLDCRAKGCRDLIGRIEVMFGRSTASTDYSTIRFNEKWLNDDCIIAASEFMKRVIERVGSLAQGSMPVLVSGETGTGKEIIARMVHRLSARAEGPFVPVNCAAIPDTVFESELFGYRKGAFTGAVSDKAGLFEGASGGTLFLDEITELTNRQQAKLLRALQEQHIRRVGETIERPVDVRLITASNEDIHSLVDSGRLRGDFYYRISGGVIELAPLRARRADILPLFTWFLCGPDGEFELEEGVAELLLKYHWPGNVRELINVAEELALLGQNRSLVRKIDLPLIIRNFQLSEPRDMNIMPVLLDRVISDGGNGSGAKCNRDLHRRIKAAMIRHRGNKTAIAQDLGIGRSTLYRRLRELGVG